MKLSNILSAVLLTACLASASPVWAAAEGPSAGDVHTSSGQWTPAMNQTFHDVQAAIPQLKNYQVTDLYRGKSNARITLTEKETSKKAEIILNHQSGKLYHITFVDRETVSQTISRNSATQIASAHLNKLQNELGIKAEAYQIGYIQGLDENNQLAKGDLAVNWTIFMDPVKPEAGERIWLSVNGEGEVYDLAQNGGFLIDQYELSELDQPARNGLENVYTVVPELKSYQIVQITQGPNVFDAITWNINAEKQPGEIDPSAQIELDVKTGDLLRLELIRPAASTKQPLSKEAARAKATAYLQQILAKEADSYRVSEIINWTAFGESDSDQRAMSTIIFVPAKKDRPNLATNISIFIDGLGQLHQYNKVVGKLVGQQK
ncbi:hypothetical protein [Brevibacillus dissolubilis]|uniref:hypothetical protein n=1 Tax=Brevibacillus dissolubilis TaxID=1844116 RepID=UPI0011177A1E|nr:hypothetical protein [Brevibacillus dissolubilis]